MSPATLANNAALSSYGRIAVCLQITFKAFQQFDRNGTTSAGGIVKQDDPAPRDRLYHLYPHVRQALYFLTRLYQHLDMGFVTMGQRRFQQMIPHQVNQWLHQLSSPQRTIHWAVVALATSTPSRVRTNCCWRYRAGHPHIFR